DAPRADSSGRIPTFPPAGDWVVETRVSSSPDTWPRWAVRDYLFDERRSSRGDLDCHGRLRRVGHNPVFVVIDLVDDVARGVARRVCRRGGRILLVDRI